jgi:surface protein
MDYMFRSSLFNGDISQWKTSEVNDMSEMFERSLFNGDISQWDISKAKNNMGWVFSQSEFKGDLRPWNLTQTEMLVTFQESLPNYLAIRQSIEEVEKLHATFGSSAPRVKKAL